MSEQEWKQGDRCEGYASHMSDDREKGRVGDIAPGLDWQGGRPGEEKRH